MPTPQNGQTYSNNSLVLATNCLCVFDYFVGLAIKGLMRMNLKYNIHHIRVRTFLEEPETVWGKLQPNLFTKK